MAHMDVVPVAKDMKSQLISIFEGTEYMLNENEEVDFDIYFSLGFDEGGMISDGILGLKEEIALVGTCEKGYADIKISYSSQGGHSSMPPGSTALVKICEAACKLEQNQMH